MGIDLSHLHSLTQIQNALRDKVCTVEDLVHYYLDKIKEHEHLNIYVEVFSEEAINKARNIDERISHGEKLGHLFGAVISIKDVLCYKNHGVTAGSKILEGFTSQYTATAIQKLLDEDAIIIGRTNCDEFAMGSTNEHSYYGATMNGLDPTRVPGGSSGAAAVSVQCDTCLIGIGSDTGGSVRQPAAFCGVYGMKPSYGRISRYGLIAYGSSFDQIGLLGKTVEDISLFLHLMCGEDSMDATSAPIDPPRIVNTRSDQSFKIGYFPEILAQPGLDQYIKEHHKETIQKLQDSGNEMIPLEFDLLDYLVPAYYVLTTAEASSNLSRYDGVHYGYRAEESKDLESLYHQTRTNGFGAEVKRRIMMGTFVLSVGYYDAYFTKAQKVRTLIIRRMKEIFEFCDALILPTTTKIAWKKGELLTDPVSMYLSDIFTVLANLGGFPAISVPQRHPELSMPFGLQIVTDTYQEERLLSLSLTFS